MDKLEKKFKETIKRIGLNKEKKIVVALSGGKDSTVVAYLLHKLGHKIEGLHIDLKIGKYSEECLKKVVELCKLLDMRLHLYDMKKEMGSGMCYLRTAIQTEHYKQKKSQIKNCAICGVIKKWILNKAVRGLKADYIATGHNLDDEAQTILMNVFKGSLELSASSGIVTKNISNKKFIPRIKPLFYIAEEDIKKYSKKNKLPVHYEGCPCAIDSYRIQIRNFLEKVPTKQKENIIKNSKKLLKRVEKKSEGVKYCENCGEPSRGKICKKCQLVGICA
ncbi:TIGR00269 family protein [archaeon]|jgi:tRNA-5-methyluridine54 2-sulfurtransferase|nr:TIGR00269 family protein [archaeon]MBT4373423.1 TIGR00269 family protein [archaeon]MBT4531871.1 TIGR00269 family protein [archaeon]MBT7001538.1 TIGR00269 family protein [archaeon]MBT7282570.1 TIGR00269 family protein [archaeon]